MRGTILEKAEQKVERRCDPLAALVQSSIQQRIKPTHPFSHLIDASQFSGRPTTNKRAPQSGSYIHSNP